MSEYNSDFQKLINYVNAATDLAESVEADVKKGKKLTSKTVLALSKFVSQANSFQKIVDQVQSNSVRLN